MNTSEIMVYNTKTGTKSARVLHDGYGAYVVEFYEGDKLVETKTYIEHTLNVVKIIAEHYTLT